jgi:hypothetical protein
MTPAFTVAPPENVFAPIRANTPEPPFTNPPDPPTTPVIVTALVTGFATVTFAAELNVPEPNVSAPVLTESPKVKVPLQSKALEKLRAAVESLDIVPPELVTVPEPSAALLPS